MLFNESREMQVTKSLHSLRLTKFTANIFKKKQFCHFILHAQTYLINFTCFI